jgi:hypothetical protein
LSHWIGHGAWKRISLIPFTYNFIGILLTNGRVHKTHFTNKGSRQIDYMRFDSKTEPPWIALPVARLIAYSPSAANAWADSVQHPGSAAISGFSCPAGGIGPS